MNSSVFRLGELCREFVQTDFFARNQNKQRTLFAFLGDQAKEDTTALPVMIDAANIALAMRKAGEQEYTEIDIARIRQSLPNIYSDAAKEIGIAFARGFCGVASEEVLGSPSHDKTSKSIFLSALSLQRLRRAGRVTALSVIIAMATGAFYICSHFYYQYQKDAAGEKMLEGKSNSLKKQDKKTKESELNEQQTAQPSIPYGTPYDRARATLIAADWYPFKSNGLWSSGIYIDPGIAQAASDSYKEFLLDQRKESASWFYNRDMGEIIDCHPQTAECTALFTNSSNQEALVTTNSGIEDRGTPKVQRVTFKEAQVR